MSKFQIGDRVRVDGYSGVYTVTSVNIEPVYTVSDFRGKCLESNLTLYSKLEPVFAVGDYVTDDNRHRGKIVAVIEDMFTAGDYKYIINTNSMFTPSEYIGLGASNLRKYDGKTT